MLKRTVAESGKGWLAGEAHTFRPSSRDYLHFVVQTPFVQGDKRTV